MTQERRKGAPLLQPCSSRMLTMCAQRLPFTRAPEQEGQRDLQMAGSGTLPSLSVTSQSQRDLTVLLPTHYLKSRLSINSMNPSS